MSENENCIDTGFALGMPPLVVAAETKAVSKSKEACVETTPKLLSLLALIPDSWPRDQFVLCGSAGLAFRGLRDVNDLDILILPALWETLSSIPGEPKEKSEVEEAYTEPDDGSVAKARSKLVRLSTDLDIFDALPCISNVTSFSRAQECADKFPSPIKDYDEFQVLCLRHILAVKALAMVPKREKDFKDMMLLTEAIAREEIIKTPKWLEVWESKFFAKMNEEA